ncbi:MAG: V-type ATPase 116kDa subunit family protein [Candidatus Micrarchaeota archaeon]
MFKPARMKKVRIFALHSVGPGVIRLLHELGTVEIKKFDAPGLGEGRPLPAFESVSEALLRLRGMISALKLTGSEEPKAESVDMLISEAKKVSDGEGSRINSLLNERGDLEEQIKQLITQQAIAERLAIFKDIDFSKLKTRMLDYAVGEISAAKLPAFKSKLEAQLKYYNIIMPDKQKGSNSLALLVYPRGEALEGLFTEFGFSQLQIPELTTHAAATVAAISKQMADSRLKIAAIEKEFAEIAAKDGKKLLALYAALSIESDRAEIASKFGKSKKVLIIEGWLKDADYGKLEGSLSRFEDAVVLQEAEIDEHTESPPVILDNPPIAGPLEFVTKSYSLPNYFEFDPTMIYFITLPILYGMIVGDVLYGILSIFIAQWFMKKFKNSETMQSVSKLWLYSAIPTIIFGIIFNEWGGFTLEHWVKFLGEWGLHIPEYGFLAYEGLSRLEQFPLVLGVTLLAGFLHLSLGFALGALKNWNHHRKHAYAKLAWLGVLLSGTAAVCCTVIPVLPAAFLMPAVAVLIISIIGLVLTEGIIGALELPGLAGNVLSYARIAAVGVVGVVLAEIINEFFMPTAANGLLMGLLLLPVLLALHGVNAFIAMFEALIQGGRLNVIEFKSKFVDGGGMPFAPFSLRSKKY